MKGISAILWFGLVALATASVNQCPSSQETDWEIELLLRHDDCDKFYKCTFGKPVEQVCPVGLYFNLEVNQCDWQKNVDCTDRNVPVEEKPEPEPEVEEESSSEEDVPEPETEVAPEPEQVEVAPEPEQEEDAPEPEQVEVAPEPEQEEVAPESEEVEVAPEPEVEEDSSSSSESSSSESSSEEEDAPEKEESASEEEQEIEFQENGCPVNPLVHWLLPDETDCNQFYYCVWGEKVLRKCPSTLHFNRAIQVCDWPRDAGCALALNKHIGSRRAILRDM